MSNEIAERLARVDASLARQLRASLERNARMTNRLRALHGSPAISAETQSEIQQILREASAFGEGPG